MLAHFYIRIDTQLNKLYFTLFTCLLTYLLLFFHVSLSSHCFFSYCVFTGTFMPFFPLTLVAYFLLSVLVFNYLYVYRLRTFTCVGNTVHYNMTCATALRLGSGV
jgi:hypothetical protein